MLCLCAAQLKFWFQTDLGRENSASYYRQGRQLVAFDFSFLTLVMRWSCSTSNFYALIGQNLTGEFMWKIYAASWNSFTLRTEADRVLCQLVMFCTVFSTGITKWNSSAIKSLCYSWLVCLLGFWLGNMSLVKVGNPISDGVVFVFGLAWCVSFQELHLKW